MSLGVSLPVLGAAARRVFGVAAPERPAGRPVHSIAIEPGMIRHAGGHCYNADLPLSMFGPAPASAGEAVGCVIESGRILGPPAQLHDLIRLRGHGGYSLWADPKLNRVTLFFSSSDNTDPRTNGRTYGVINQPLQFADDWNHWLQRSWKNHSRGAYFLRRGGHAVAPPLYASLGITDICNLKCGICGSQNMLTPVNRRHMDIGVFRRVADTIFPLLVTVELNSRGEPMIHPHFTEMQEIMLDYDIFTRYQTNGTQFVARKLALLAKTRGDVSISIDATGDLFEYARTGAKWEQVDQGTRNLMKVRDPQRLGVGLYPTLTAKTIEGAAELIDWAVEVGVDRIDFHVYEPIEAGVEAAPSQRQLDDLKRYAARIDRKHPIQISVEFEIVKAGELPPVDRPAQMRYANIPRPADSPSAHPEYACMAPVQNVEIDLDGCVCVCCRTQDRKLGNAMSVEAFADCWFGAEYEAIRASLRRDSPGPPVIETCRGCVKHYTAGSGIVEFAS